MRILVVDDAVVARRLIADILTEAGFDVVGSAANGSIALAKIARLHPDVVTLDLDMPELDGLETLSRIRTQFPNVQVVMVSNHTERGASATVEALFRGATDYVTKAYGAPTPAAAREQLASQLIPKLRSLEASPRAVVRSPDRPLSPQRRRAGRVPISAVGVAASTGGPTALAELLSQLPVDLSLPLLVVQHMPENFTSYLATRLDARCSLSVAEASDGVAVTPGHVWVAPGNRHLEVRASRSVPELVTTTEPPVNSCRPSADVLFRSLAATYGAGVLAVVLTGMGQDGLRGCDAIRAEGGRVIAQDQRSSVVWGMPGQVVTAGLASMVAPPPELGREIGRLVEESRP